MAKTEKCELCNGSGEAEFDLSCPDCNGTGEIIDDHEETSYDKKVLNGKE